MHTVSAVLLIILGVLSCIGLVKSVVDITNIVIKVRKFGWDTDALILVGVHPMHAILLNSWHKMDKFSKVIAAVPIVGGLLLSAYLVVSFLYGTLTWKLVFIIIGVQALLYACTLGIVSYHFHKQNIDVYGSAPEAEVSIQ